MNTKSNLDNALNKAFENYEEPLNEAQWNRLKGDIVERKKKRFLPFLFLLTLVSFTAGTTYFLTLNYGIKNHLSGVKSITQKSVATEQQSAKSYLINESSTISSMIALDDKYTSYKNYNTKKKYASHQDNTIENSTFNKKESTEKLQNNVSTSETINDEQQKNNKFEESEVTSPEVTETKMEQLKTKDTSYSSTAKNDDSKEAVKPASKYAFSLTGGISKMNVKVKGIENSEMLHKDTRKIFEESNQNLKTEFFTLGFDWNLFPRFRIGINSGIQYIRVATPLNINYQLTEIPFWNNRHTQIEGYITDTSSHALKFNTNSTNYTTYLSIPLRGYWTLPLNPRNEILFSAGTNLSILASAKGQNISINRESNQDPGIKNLDKNRYRIMNMGLIGGIQYNTKLKDSWWLGLESILQTNSLKYNTGNGSIKSKMQGYNFNLVLKYKI